MSLQDISRDIQSKAQVQKQVIEQQAKDEISTLEKEFESNFNSYKEKVMSKHNSEVKVLTSKINSQYSKQCKEIELDAKSQVLTQVKIEALDKISNLPKSAKEKVLTNLIKLASDHIDYKTVFTSKDDLEFVKSKCKSATVKSKIGLNGLVFENKEGTEKLDLTFENLFTEIFSENEASVQKILFQ